MANNTVENFIMKIYDKGNLIVLDNINYLEC